MTEGYFDQLIESHLSGVTSPEQGAELEQRLLHSAADRRRFWQLAEINTLLHEASQLKMGEPIPTPSSRRAQTRWLGWRPLTAAAAGLVLGLFCNSALLAYTQPRPDSSVSKILPLVDASFEASTEMPPTGIPQEAGRWSGDFAGMAEAENGVTPRQGRQMLRFLRADNKNSADTKQSYVSEVSQVIDLRPLRGQFPQATSLVELSAMFNAIPADLNSKYEFAVKAAAFRGEITDAPELWENAEAEVSRSTCSVFPDSDASTWQRVVVPLMVPQDADFIVIQCAVALKYPKAESRVAEFPGHYVDQVELRLSHSAGAVDDEPGVD